MEQPAKEKLFKLFYYEVKYNRKQSEELAQKHSKINYRAFKRWYEYFHLTAELTKQESIEWAFQYMNLDVKRAIKWFEFLYLETDYQKSKAAILAVNTYYRSDIEAVGQWRNFLFNETDLSRTRSAFQALECLNYDFQSFQRRFSEVCKTKNQKEAREIVIEESKKKYTNRSKKQISN